MTAVNETITTPLTELLGIKHPIILAGMNVAAGPQLAAAVSAAGGLGVIGGVGYTPKMLDRQIKKLKKHLPSPDMPFGVDLLLPQVGGSARKTNTDYTEGKLPELIDLIINSGAKLFVSAVGVPPTWVVEKLHSGGVLVANIIGSPKHVPKALAAGVDIIIAQGGEGGGHTGEVATSILVPTVVDLCKGVTSKFTGQPVHVIAAGGIYDGRGLAMALCYGAQAVWVGTRFICANEASAPKRHQQGVIDCGFHDTQRTIIYSGRPMRVRKNAYIADWESRPDQIKDLTSRGIVPVYHDMNELEAQGKSLAPDELVEITPLLMGQVSGAINDIKPAQEIVDDMVNLAVKSLKELNGRIRPRL